MFSMETIKVNKLLNGQTTISKTNSKVWEMLCKIMASKKEDEAVLFDFEEMDLLDPWTNIEFQTFIKDERVHIKLYNSQEEINTINQLCKIANVSCDRCINETVHVDRLPSDEEKKLDRYIKRTEASTTVTNGRLVLDYGYDNISEKIVLQAIREMLKSKKDIKSIVFNFGNVLVHDTMLKPLADFYIELKQNYDVEMNILDEDIKGKVNTFITTNDSNNMTDAEKMKLFESLVEENQAGVLTLYKKGKKKDALGRSGEGEIVFTRPAIYRGFKKSESGITLVFDTFNGNKFYRQLDYKLDNGGHELGKLEPDVYEFEISEIGVFDKMRGTLAHFNNPITLDKKDMRKVYVKKDFSDELTTAKKTLPQFMKMVLDDHDIEYNKVALMRCITANNKYLKQKEK